jgi:RNA polymerase sigma factor (sigma-70 family)
VNSSSDQELLQAYAEKRSEAAFTELARRHLDFVYSVARRMAREEAAARDVTQGVFMALAKDARKLAGRPVLAGWLHRTAQNLASSAIRTEARRRAREEEAAVMNETLPESTDLWEQIAPQLDGAIGQLREKDRDALLLRYFHDKSIREVAGALATTEEAAQKRVNRALERLRKILARNGVAAGTGGLAASIAANSVQAAPMNLAQGILAEGLIAGSGVTTKAVTKGLMMWQKAMIGLTGAATVVTVLCAARLNAKLSLLQQEDAALRQQLAQAEKERDDALGRLAIRQARSAEAQENIRDLARLRAEVARLRDRTNAIQAAVIAPSEITSNQTAQIFVQGRFVTLSSVVLNSLGISWSAADDGGRYSLLTSNQVAQMDDAMQNSGLDILTLPRIVTGDDIPANLTGTTQVELNGTNFDVGPSLNVTAHFSTNDSLFDITVGAQLNELLGDSLHPEPYALAVSNRMTLLRGQTLVMTQDIPTNAWQPEHTMTTNLPCSLIVTVTPEAIDAAGNLWP